MEVVEKRLEVTAPKAEDVTQPPLNDSERTLLLDLATQLAEPELSVDTRMALVDCICRVLNYEALPEEKQLLKSESGR